MPPELVDHRYFYAECPPHSQTHLKVGKHACGIARDAAARQLRLFRMGNFGDTDFLKALNDYIDNPSVTGFFIEQAVLSSIASRGLDISKDISTPMDTVMFAGNFPTLEKKSNPVLYCPLKFNYRGIDAIIVRFDYSRGKKLDKNKCFMFPLQVIVAKSHTDSEQAFFDDWSLWSEGLDDFDVVVEFLWITTEASSAANISGNSRSIRSGIRSGWPSYTRRNIHLLAVNPDIWARYQQALKKSKKQSSTYKTVSEKPVLKETKRSEKSLKSEK